MERPSVHTHVARRPLTTVVVLAIVVVLAFAGIAVARYVLQQQQDGLATATDFYFTSDYLKESGEKASYFIDPVTTSFSVTLSNSADSQRFTSGDVKYDITASGATVTDSQSGTLSGGGQSTATLTVEPTAEDSFTVTASSSSPYTKELTATFTLAKGNFYKVEDAANNTAAVLTITCTDSGGPVAITLPAGVVPDATDGRVSPASDGSYSFKAGGSGVYSLVLLKSDKTKDLANEGDFADKIDLNTSSDA